MLSEPTNPLEIFIEGWGRMGSQWGISKVMAEIYALLYLSPHPMSLEEMSEKLQTSRSNISTNVRALQDLGVVRKALIRGDRKDYYTVEEDIRKVAVRIAEGKKKRELDPGLEIVNDALSAALSLKEKSSSPDENLNFCITRLQTLKNLVETVKGIFEAFIESDSVIETNANFSNRSSLK